MKESENQQLEEYRTLREEILQNQRSLGQLIAFFISVSAAVFGFALNANNSYVLLAPLILLVPGVYLVVGHWEQMFRIAAYIRLVIEPDVLGLSWETHWAALRRSPVQFASNPFWKVSKTITVLVTFHGFQFICLTAAFLIGPADQRLFIVIGLILLVHLVHSIYFARRATDSEYHEKFWTRYFEQAKRKE